MTKRITKAETKKALDKAVREGKITREQAKDMFKWVCET